jgi:hypothetical protein
MKSGEGLDCISLTSCRIRFTAGLLRLNLPVAAIASAAGDRLASPPTLTGAGYQPSNWELERGERGLGGIGSACGGGFIGAGRRVSVPWDR